MKRMNVTQLCLSRRSITMAAAFLGMVSLAIGAHAALNMRALDAAKAVEAEQTGALKGASRIALVIGNGNYPDASAPLAQPINDARALTAALRRNGFDVDVVEDAGKDDMNRAIGRLKSKIRPDSVVMLFFGGYGVQVGRESYMIPVDAVIWKEADVRRDGFSIEQVLNVMKEQGARAKLVVVDASRRNPYERRFRAYSHGLAPISAPDNALILTSATPGKVADDSEGAHSVLMSELLQNLNAEGGVETLFNKNRARYARSKLRYPSDLTDEEWGLVEPLIPPGKTGGGKRTVIMREVVNGLMYILSTGCQWRAIPKDLPPKSSVHDYFDLWTYDGTLERIHDALYERCRERAQRKASPTAAIIDSQSVKSAEKGGRALIRTGTMRARRSRARSGTFLSTQ